MPIFYTISLFFLALSFVCVYFRNRQKLFGLMTLSMIAMLFGFYVCILIPLVGGLAHVHEHPWECQTVGFLIQFFYLSSMCWLNSMCFDIWSGFRHFRAPSVTFRNSEIHKRYTKYKWYCLWSWGCPTIVVLVTLTMQYLPKDLTRGYKLPEMGKHNCFMGQEGAIYYLHAINLPILVCNILLFLFSSWNICCGVWKSTIPKVGSSIPDQYRLRARTLTKLFFVVGITWIAEVTSFFLHNFIGMTGSNGAILVKVSVFFDIINASQGFIMFCVIFFDSGTIKNIKEFKRCSIMSKKIIVFKTWRSHSTNSNSSRTHQGPPRITTQVELTEMWNKPKLEMAMIKSLQDSFQANSGATGSGARHVAKITTVDISDHAGNRGKIMSRIYHV